MSRPRPAHRHRGSVLVLVLGVTSLVGVIGLSGILAVRLQHRDVQLRADAAQARHLADAALQIVYQQLVADPNWRNDEAAFQWSDSQTLAGGHFRFRLTLPSASSHDHDDHEVEAPSPSEIDPDQPLTLLIRATFGQAVRLVSIDLGPAQLGPELASNPYLDDAAQHYFTFAGEGEINAAIDTPYLSKYYLQLNARFKPAHAIHQNLDGRIASATTYQIEAWVRTAGSSETLNAGLSYPTLLTSRTAAFSATAGPSTSTRIRGQVQPSFTDYSSMSFFLASQNTSQDLHLGRLSVRQVLRPISVIRGSYHRQLDR